MSKQDVLKTPAAGSTRARAQSTPQSGSTPVSTADSSNQTRSQSESLPSSVALLIQRFSGRGLVKSRTSKRPPDTSSALKASTPAQAETTPDQARRLGDQPSASGVDKTSPVERDGPDSMGTGLQPAASTRVESASPDSSTNPVARRLSFDITDTTQTEAKKDELGSSGKDVSDNSPKPEVPPRASRREPTVEGGGGCGKDDGGRDNHPEDLLLQHVDRSSRKTSLRGARQRDEIVKKIKTQNVPFYAGTLEELLGDQALCDREHVVLKKMIGDLSSGYSSDDQGSLILHRLKAQIDSWESKHLLGEGGRLTKDEQGVLTIAIEIVVIKAIHQAVKEVNYVDQVKQLIQEASAFFFLMIVKKIRAEPSRARLKQESEYLNILEECRNKTIQIQKSREQRFREEAKEGSEDRETRETEDTALTQLRRAVSGYNGENPPTVQQKAQVLELTKVSVQKADSLDQLRVVVEATFDTGLVDHERHRWRPIAHTTKTRNAVNAAVKKKMGPLLLALFAQPTFPQSVDSFVQQQENTPFFFLMMAVLREPKLASYRGPSCFSRCRPGSVNIWSQLREKERAFKQEAKSAKSKPKGC
jgi:hypothetical protein